MTRLPGISAELAAAIRAVNVAYERCPEPRPDPAGYEDLDRELDTACAGDDRARASAAIRVWRRHWLSVLEEAAR